MSMTRRLCKEVIICKDFRNGYKSRRPFLNSSAFFKEKDVILENISCASSKVGKYKGFLAVTSHVRRKG